jgi:hypothetical protein
MNMTWGKPHYYPTNLQSTRGDKVLINSDIKRHPNTFKHTYLIIVLQPK